MSSWFKYTLITLVLLAILWEVRALYRSWAVYSQAQLKKLHELPISKRPNRRGHFIGNLLRFLDQHWRR